MQRTGIDQPRAAYALIGAHVRVALQKILVILRRKQALLELLIVAMNDGNTLVVEREVGKVAIAWDIDALRVSRKASTVVIGIAEDEGALQASEKIDAFLRSDVAAMDEELRTILG